MAEPDKKKKWWQSLPAILTAVAAVLGSAAGLVSALWPTGISGPQAEVTSLTFDGGLAITVESEPEDLGTWHPEWEHHHQVIPDELHEPGS